MKEDYVTFEQAKALKELGFNEKVFFYFNYETKEIEPNSGASYSEGGPFDTYDVLRDVTKYGSIPAPTLALTQKWLREVKGIDVHYSYGRKKWTYYWGRRWTQAIYEEEYDTPIEALSAGIDRVIKYLKSL